MSESFRFPRFGRSVVLWWGECRRRGTSVFQYFIVSIIALPVFRFVFILNLFREGTDAADAESLPVIFASSTTPIYGFFPLFYKPPLKERKVNWSVW